MIQKRNKPFLIYGLLLPPMLVLAYFIGGVFRFDDLTLMNFQDRLAFIFEHPMAGWMNEKTPACLGVALLCWVLLVNYLSYHYRNYHFGKEFGDEDWADVHAVNRELCDLKDDRNNRVLSRNLSISTKGKLSNMNMLVIGSSGTYKTNSVVTPNLLRCNANYIVLDVKGELMYKYGRYLSSQGYTIRSLNLKDPEKSDRYNPFEYIEKEEDLIRLITNIQDALTPPDAMKGDPFWQDGAALYLQSVFYYEWYMARAEGRKGSMNNILKLVNDETKKVDGGDAPEGKSATKLQCLMKEAEKKFGEDFPAARDYRKLKEGATETVRSIIIIVNAQLKLMETQGVKRIFETDELNLREFATGIGGSVEKPTNKKMALFLIIPDNDKSFNFIVSMLYTQAFDILMRMADNDFRSRGGSLPIPLEFWMDEFYAGARPHDPEALMGVIRSRNISMIPILQSVSQIKALFRDDKWQIVMDNCAVMMYLGSGSGALDTHKYISDLLGKQTIDTANDAKNGMNTSMNYNRTGRELMTPAEVRRMSRQDCIIFIEGQRPVMDRKALPWEMPEDIVPFKKAMAMNEHGGYVNEVRVVNGKDGKQYTITKKQKGPVHLITEDEQAQRRSGKQINMTENEFMNLNLHPDSRERRYLMTMKQVIDHEEGEAAESAEVVPTHSESAEEKKPEKESGTGGTENGTAEDMNLSGSVLECINRNAEMLGTDAVNLLLEAKQNGVPDEEIRRMMQMPFRRMQRAYMVYSLRK